MSSSDILWKRAILPIESTIQQAIRNLDDVAIRIILVVNKKRELQGTISDGDIRRGLLKGLSLSSPIASIVHRNALVVPTRMTREMVMQLMIANKIQQIPVVDKNQQVVGLHLWDKINVPSKRPNPMIIMAGGMGTRLRPHTEKCPKPMLPVAGKPILEHIIDQAKQEGFSRFILAIHYLGEIIENHFGRGSSLGVNIDYIKEKMPLGTSGALGLLSPKPDVPFIVTNGDVLSDIRYGEMLDFHIRNNAAATMAVRLHEWQNPFGVVETKGFEIISFKEKPVYKNHINAGVYAISPDALKNIARDKYCEMPELFRSLKTDGKKTVAYPMHEPWLDIGKPKDLEKSQKQKLQKKVKQ